MMCFIGRIFTLLLQRTEVILTKHLLLCESSDRLVPKCKFLISNNEASSNLLTRKEYLFHVLQT